MQNFKSKLVKKVVELTKNNIKVRTTIAKTEK